MRTGPLPSKVKMRQTILALRSFVGHALGVDSRGDPAVLAKDPSKTSSGESVQVGEETGDATKLPALQATIVCVDEDPVALERLRVLLTEAGLEVIAMSDGAAALERIWQRLPDLLILDPMMDNMVGLELCRRLRAAPETNHIPIVLHTAATAPTDQSLYNCVCSKPAERSALLLVIRTLLMVRP